MLIQDGRTGDTAAVNSRNHLVTTSVAIAEDIYVALQDSEAYLLATAELTIPANFDGPILLLKNLDPQRDIIVHPSITVSIDAFSAGAAVALLRNPTIGTLANETAKISMNTNFESGQLANVDSFEWDGVGTAGITGITAVANGTFGPLPLATGPNNLDVPLILGAQSAVSLRLVSGAAGYQAHALIHFYFDTTGAK